MAAKTTSQSRVIHDKQLIDRRTVKSSETRETFEVQLSIPTTISYRREADPPPLSSSTPLDTDTPPRIYKIDIYTSSIRLRFFPPDSLLFPLHSLSDRVPDRRETQGRRGNGRRRKGERWDSRIDPGKITLVRWRRRRSSRVNEQKSTGSRYRSACFRPP